MKYETRFNLGDQVYIIASVYTTRKARCVTCESTGNVTIVCEQFTCPKCKGTCTQEVYAGHKYIVCEEGKIGSIRIEQRGKYGNLPSYTDIIYMLSPSGSGTLYQENNVFASRQEAEKACEHRNMNIQWEDDVLSKY